MLDTLLRLENHTSYIFVFRCRNKFWKEGDDAILVSLLIVDSETLKDCAEIPPSREDKVS